MRAEIAICVQRWLNARRDSYLCAEIPVFVLNLSDMIFLRTAPHKKLLTTCQHRKHNITCLSDWPIYRCHSQLRQRSCPNLSCDQFRQSCSAGGKIAPGVYILPHKVIVACEIIFFVYMAW